MKCRRKKDPIPIRSGEEAANQGPDAYEQNCSRLWEVKLQQMPLTIDFDRLLDETNLSRSKAFELLKDGHKNFDPRFPKGVPLYNSERSPRFWWSHRVVAWLMWRDANNQPIITKRD